MTDKLKKRTVGVVGLGNMGSGITRNLAKAGHNVLVWDINKEVQTTFVNIATSTSPMEMASKCSVIFFVVPSSKEIGPILKGRHGILTKACRGLVVYDLTTSNPLESKKLARSAKAKKVSYLDAGMTGGASGADQGSLKLMVGGDKRAFNRTRYIAEAFASQLFYLGPSGTGHTMKLIFNMVVHTNFLVICEASLMAEKSGIPLSDMIEIFNTGNARNYASERRFPDHVLSGTWDARSRIHNLNKDVGMAVEMANNLGLPVNIGRGTLGYIKKAVKAGMSEDDFSLLYKEFKKLTEIDNKL